MPASTAVSCLWWCALRLTSGLFESSQMVVVSKDLMDMKVTELKRTSLTHGVSPRQATKLGCDAGCMRLLSVIISLLVIQTRLVDWHSC